MNSTQLRVGFAALVAVVATTGAIVGANAASRDGADEGQPVGAGIGGPHLSPLGDDSMGKIPETDVVASGITPSGARYEVALAPDEDGRICYEIRHKTATAMGCGVELPDSPSSSVTIPAAFGDDVIAVTFTGAEATRVAVKRGDETDGSERSAPVTDHGSVRFSHAVLRIPQATWPKSEMSADSDAPAAPPIPPALEITTYDRSDRVIERKTQSQGPVG